MKSTKFLQTTFCGLISLSIISVIGLCSSTASAQEGECDDGMCGTPDESGGGEGGGGSVLIANTDLGDTSNYADDYDEDGFEDDFDNCPWHPNPTQLDRDSDGWGDACDTCFATWNPNQFDRDNDGFGDWCDDDVDGDGVPNQNDNCGALNNPGQVDTDGDGEGDVCDDDDDNDGVTDMIDECPLLHRRHYSRNMVCAHDMDGDYVKDHVDNCPSSPNPHQRDEDRDGIGDMCDIDLDGNGIADRSEWRPDYLEGEYPPSEETLHTGGGCAVATNSYASGIKWVQLALIVHRLRRML